MEPKQQYDVSDSESDYDSVDSQDDPTFDILEETRSSLSRLSIKKNISKDMSARRNVSKVLEECVEGEQDKIVPELDEKDQKSYETVQKIIKGDACTGDVVMFNIASRSATGPLCGTRIVAGWIVKESYGAKKQQHTFTVEVLWSKGEKLLLPLHPLLIKGRNLYRLKTLRQKWDNEAERQKILSEKYARGYVARSNRETRVREKEMRQIRKENRVSTDHKEKKTKAERKGRKPHQHQKNTEYSEGKLLHSLSMNSVNKKDQAQVEVVDKGQKDDQKECRNYASSYREQEKVFSTENRPNQRQPLTNVNLNHPSSYREQRGFGESYTSNPSKSPLRMHNSNMHMPMWRGSNYGGNTNSNSSPLRMHNANAHNITTWRGYNDGGYSNYNTSKSPLQGHGGMYTYGHSQNMNYRSPQRTENWQARNGWCDVGAAKRPFQGQREEQKRPCRFYAQGRCYYGHSCRYLHDSVDI